MITLPSAYTGLFYILYGPGTITKGLRSQKSRVRIPVQAEFSIRYMAQWVGQNGSEATNRVFAPRYNLDFLHFIQETIQNSTYFRKKKFAMPLIQSNKSTISGFESKHNPSFLTFYIKNVQFYTGNYQKSTYFQKKVWAFGLKFFC